LKTIHVIGMHGLGDNIFQRPFVHALSLHNQVYLETSWPELYGDLPNVRFVRRNVALRTQTKNVNRSDARWLAPPSRAAKLKISYTKYLEKFSIIHGMQCSFGCELNPALFDLPRLPPAPFSCARPIAFVRPVTIRREWRNEARNPKPQYIAQIAGVLRETHHVVCVADVDGVDEVFEGQLPPADTNFVHGELSAMQALALMAISDVVIGGVGWIVPASIALKKSAFVVLGGHGGHNAPERITDPRLDLSRLGFAMPQRFCLCTNMRHTDCEKTIADLMEQFSAFIAKRRTCETRSLLIA
jgi:hypothetical protein